MSVELQTSGGQAAQSAPAAPPAFAAAGPVAPGRAFTGRSTLIDALRGIAALAVACYHINRYGPMPGPASQLIPQGLAAWIDHGWIGVQVFFVISGFVIAYSVRDALITPRYVANYALRRSIRLDPPYWTTILFVLVVHFVMALHLGFESPLDVPSEMTPGLSWKVVGAHLLYLQNIIGYDNISAGFWTLCIEVQFYLVYVIGLGLIRWLVPRRPGSRYELSPMFYFGALAVASLFLWNIDAANQTRFNPAQDYWLTHFFCMFFLGIAAWWALDGKIPHAAFWIYCGAMAVRLALPILGLTTEPREESSYLTHQLIANWPLELCVALVAGVTIYVAGRAGRLGTALNFRWLQYLGRISYSLYLVHFPVAHIVTTFGLELMGSSEDINSYVALAWMLLALAASIGVAHLMYTFVEAPSVRLAARFKPRS